ncbi:hypothetical protein N9Y67_00090 [Pseudomonadota bacterium]|nr:hypothetical protein [Pseudomonadota bacterium]
MTLQIDNKADAIDYRDELADSIDDLSLTANDASFNALAALRKAIVIDSHSRIAQLPNLVEHTLDEALPAVVLAYNLYGDVSRDVDLIKRNKIKHGGFIIENHAIEYLK